MRRRSLLGCALGPSARSLACRHVAQARGARRSRSADAPPAGPAAGDSGPAAASRPADVAPAIAAALHPPAPPPTDAGDGRLLVPKTRAKFGPAPEPGYFRAGSGAAGARGGPAPSGAGRSLATQPHAAGASAPAWAAVPQGPYAQEDAALVLRLQARDSELRGSWAAGAHGPGPAGLAAWLREQLAVACHWRELALLAHMAWQLQQRLPEQEAGPAAKPQRRCSRSVSTSGSSGPAAGGQAQPLALDLLQATLARLTPASAAAEAAWPPAGPSTPDAVDWSTSVRLPGARRADLLAFVNWLAQQLLQRLACGGNDERLSTGAAIQLIAGLAELPGGGAMVPQTQQQEGGGGAGAAASSGADRDAWAGEEQLWDATARNADENEHDSDAENTQAGGAAAPTPESAVQAAASALLPQVQLQQASLAQLAQLLCAASRLGLLLRRSFLLQCLHRGAAQANAASGGAAVASPAAASSAGDLLWALARYLPPGQEAEAAQQLQALLGCAGEALEQLPPRQLHRLVAAVEQLQLAQPEDWGAQLREAAAAGMERASVADAAALLRALALAGVPLDEGWWQQASGALCASAAQAVVQEGAGGDGQPRAPPLPEVADAIKLVRAAEQHGLQLPPALAAALLQGQCATRDAAAAALLRLLPCVVAQLAAPAAFGGAHGQAVRLLLALGGQQAMLVGRPKHVAQAAIALAVCRLKPDRGFVKHLTAALLRNDKATPINDLLKVCDLWPRLDPVGGPSRQLQRLFARAVRRLAALTAITQDRVRRREAKKKQMLRLRQRNQDRRRQNEARRLRLAARQRRLQGSTPLERTQVQEKRRDIAVQGPPPPPPTGKASMTWRQRKLKPPGTLKRVW